MERLKIDEYRELIDRVGLVERLEDLRELENRVIREVVYLVFEGSSQAKAKLSKLETAVIEKMAASPSSNRLLKIALYQSLSGAFSAGRAALD
jgi:hypothetical protein